MVSTYFPGTSCSVGVVDLEGIAADVLALHSQGFDDPVTYKRGTALPRSGQYGQAKGGEFHALNPRVFNPLRKAAVTKGEPGLAVFKKYAEQVDSRPLTSLRDCLDFNMAGTDAIPLEEVESAKSIASRFCTQVRWEGGGCAGVVGVVVAC